MKRLFAFLSMIAAVAVSSAWAAELPVQLGQMAADRSPYNLIGQLFFSSGNTDYIGSGIVIRPKSILTAGHNLYDPDTGWSTDLLFRRGAYGDEVKSESYGARIYLVSGYRQNANYYGTDSPKTFATDSGGVVFSDKPAMGAYAGFTTDRALLMDATVYKIAIGYGAEGEHTGDYPLYVVPKWPFASTYGNFYEAKGASIEGGMSGGPLFVRFPDGKLYVAGVVVSQSNDNMGIFGGIRALNPGMATFITTYLH